MATCKRMTCTTKCKCKGLAMLLPVLRCPKLEFNEMADKKGKAEGSDSDDNDGTENDDSLCNRVIATLKEGGELDSLSLKEHKAYLRIHGLRITGTKAVCQQRILEHWENDESVCNRVIAILKEGGELESLSLKELKAYLRIHGLRITGTKAVCQQRILEHWRDETEEKEKEEDKGNNWDDNDGTENGESLCNRVIAVLKEGSDLESMSLKELKAYLRNHGLHVTGTKATCQQRILEHWEDDESVCKRVVAILKEGGDLESLSLKELRAYLRNHGLSITGTKAVCQQRILEHWSEDETKEEEEEKGNDLDDHDQMQNNESLCKQVIAILKEGGDLESLSLKELKAYLRNHGLRIAGTKAVCQQRILEHWSGDKTEEEEEDEGNNLDDNDQTENDKSLCNRVIAILKEGGDLESLRSKELKAYLRNHGLLSTGNKALCQQRILEHWSGDETEEDEDEGNDSDGNDQTEKDKSLCNQVIEILKEGGDLKSLSLKELKAYLRNHGLLITGTKAVCQQRILEHWRIKEGNAEALYPRSSFFIDCTGDVCKGDVVLFTQKVYKKFDNMSRRRLLGKRTIAGRVVKESYGKAKQQHTFTVEVLWSEGTKKLPLLFPLLVKGRNLYKLRTYRQRWCDEAERRNVLAEKHKRGKAARLVKAMESIRKWSADVGTKHPRRSHQSRPSENIRALGRAKIDMAHRKARPSKIIRALERAKIDMARRKARPSKRIRELERAKIDMAHRKARPSKIIRAVERAKIDMVRRKARPSKRMRELERAKIDMAHRKAFIPRLWHTSNIYQVSSPVGQSKKKQRSRSSVSDTFIVTRTGGLVAGPAVPRCNHCGRRHSGECWRTFGACFRCGSKDHFLRTCPGRPGATSLPPERPSATSVLFERPSATSVLSEMPSATSEMSERPSGSSEPSERLSATFVPSERPSATFVPSEKPSGTSVPSEGPTPTTQQDGDVGTSATFVTSERPTPTTQQDGDVGMLESEMVQASLSATSVLSKRPSGSYVPSESPTPTTQQDGAKHQKHSHQSRRSQKRKASELEKGKIDKAEGKAFPSAWNAGNVYQVSSPVGQVKKKQKSRLRVSNTSYTVTSTGGCGSKDHLIRSCPMGATSVPSKRMGATSVPSERPTSLIRQDGDVGTIATSVWSERPSATSVPSERPTPTTQQDGDAGTSAPSVRSERPTLTTQQDGDAGTSAPSVRSERPTRTTQQDGDAGMSAPSVRSERPTLTTQQDGDAGTSAPSVRSEMPTLTTHLDGDAGKCATSVQSERPIPTTQQDGDVGMSATSILSKRPSATSVPSERPTPTTQQDGDVGTSATFVPSERPTPTTQQDGDVGASATSIQSERPSVTSIPSERPSASYVSSERPTPTPRQDGDVGTKHEEHSHQSRQSEKRKASELEKEKIDKAQGNDSIPRFWNTGNTYQVSFPVGQVEKKQKSRLRVSNTSYTVTSTGGSCPMDATSVPSKRMGATSVPSKRMPATSVPSERPTSIIPQDGDVGTIATSVWSERPSATSVPSERPTPTTQQDGDAGTSAPSVRSERPTLTTQQDGDAGTSAPSVRSERPTLTTQQDGDAGMSATSILSKRPSATSVPSERPTPTTQQDGDVGTSATSIPSERPMPTTQQDGDVGASATSIQSERPSVTSIPSERPSASYVSSERPTPTPRQDGDVGTKHEEHSHQSRQPEKRKASELEKEKIDKAQGNDSVPRFWNTGNTYQVSFPVGQVEKKQKSTLTVYNTYYNVTNTGGSCPERMGATSVPSESSTLTAQRGMRPGNSGNTGGEQRFEREIKHGHSNVVPVLNSYQPPQNFHHQSAPHQFAGNDIASSFHHQSAPHQFAGNDIGSSFHHQSAPQFASNNIGSSFHHQSAPHQFAGNNIGSSFHHQSAPHQFAGNDIGSTFHYQSAPHQFVGNDTGSTFHHQSAPHKFVGNDIGSTSAMVRSLPYIPCMDPHSDRIQV
ncbi:hypothetical protein V6N11_023632 [Hibiscus sabdariffa]|uniref:Uncharacterized protein n=1 Tax=Hibiscus sabdariffa TaxID=183260 RepID=A0ABR2TMS4_9ROSI